MVSDKLKRILDLAWVLSEQDMVGITPETSLDDIEAKMHIDTIHPFRNMTREDIENPLLHLLKVMRNPDYFPFTCKLLFNIEIMPFQHLILKQLWTKTSPMLIGSRGLSKSFLLALYAMLRLTFTQGCKIAIIGAAFRQSKVIFEYMENMWANGPILREFCGSGKGFNDREQGPRRDVDRCEMIIGDSLAFAIPLGNGCATGCTQTTYGDCFGSLADEHNTIGEQLVVKRDRMVWGPKGFIKTDEAYVNGLRPTKKIKTRSGYFIECTHDHKLKVVVDGEIVWKTIGDIVHGDKMVIDKSERWHSGQSNFSSDDGYLLGIMIGDGCWTDSYCLGYATADKQLEDFVTNCELKFKKTSDGVHFTRHGKEIQKQWLNKWGLKYARSNTKSLPLELLKSEKDIVTACISGLYDTDGHVQASTAKGGTSITVGFTTTSEKLVNQLQYILLHYGIVSTKLSRHRNLKHSRSYELLITGADVIAFHEKIGFRLERKREKLANAIAAKKRILSQYDDVPCPREWIKSIFDKYGGRNYEWNWSRFSQRKRWTKDFVNKFLDAYSDVEDEVLEKLRVLADPDYFYDPVSEVSYGEAMTYDIHVPDTHTYCANGFISHNSKIRGQRAGYILADEYASIPEEIYQTVVRGFAAVSTDPVGKTKNQARIRLLKTLGMWTEENEKEEARNMGGNQNILSGTADYAFNHFAKTWKHYKQFIESRGDKKKLQEIFNGPVPPSFNWRDFCIMRIPADLLPAGFMDAKQLASARVTVNKTQYLREYSAVFPTDSDGFFRRSLIEKCVVGHEDNPIRLPTSGLINFHADVCGEPGVKHVFGIDPASERDNFAIVIVAIYPDHRRIVYSWTIRKKSFNIKVKKGLVKENDFYAYCARKIRDLMITFPCVRICIDSQGGGRTIEEKLHSEKDLGDGELPIWQIKDEDPKKWKESDDKPGLHILELVNFSDAQYTSDANHGMRMDFESRVLLFPFFDPAVIGEAIESDKESGRVYIDDEGDEVSLYDTLSDCVDEIEQLKDELASIVISQTPNGRDKWDTPETMDITTKKKGRQRKDRYSALLMANMGARTIAAQSKPPEIISLGGFAHVLGGTKREHGPSQLYQGPDWYVRGVRACQGGMVVRRN